MKKALALFLTSFAVGAFAAQNDVLITFSTPGPDTYADGVTKVADGECYALVWTKTGCEFSGFRADGTVASEDSRVLIVTPSAKDGRCPPMVFEVAASVANSLTGGSYGVYLLDTRNASGQPMGVTRDAASGVNVPVAVNGYGIVADSTTELSKAGVTKSARVRARSRATVRDVSSLPENAPRPIVKAIRVENGKVYVTVANTAPYLQYNVSRGRSPATIGKSAADVNVAAPAQGDGTREIVLEAPADGSAGFLRVNRN